LCVYFEQPATQKANPKQTPFAQVILAKMAKETPELIPEDVNFLTDYFHCFENGEEVPGYPVQVATTGVKRPLFPEQEKRFNHERVFVQFLDKDKLSEFGAEQCLDYATRLCKSINEYCLEQKRQTGKNWKECCFIDNDKSFVLNMDATYSDLIGPEQALKLLVAQYSPDAVTLEDWGFNNEEILDSFFGHESLTFEQACDIHAPVEFIIPSTVPPNYKEDYDSLKKHS